MKTCTILALLVAICAVFLIGVGYTEETAEVERQPFEDEEKLTDSFNNPENDDNDDDDDDPKEFKESSLSESEQGLESVNETPSSEEDEPEMFKRAPWRRRRRRRRFFRIRFRRIRFRRIRFRFRFRKIKDKLKKLHSKILKGCKLILPHVNHPAPKAICKIIQGDEEAKRMLTNEENAVPGEQNDKAIQEESWLDEAAKGLTNEENDVPDEQNDKVQEKSWLDEE